MEQKVAERRESGEYGFDSPSPTTEATGTSDSHPSSTPVLKISETEAIQHRKDSDDDAVGQYLRRKSSSKDGYKTVRKWSKSWQTSEVNAALGGPHEAADPVNHPELKTPLDGSFDSGDQRRRSKSLSSKDSPRATQKGDMPKSWRNTLRKRLSVSGSSRVSKDGSAEESGSNREGSKSQAVSCCAQYAGRGVSRCAECGKSW